MKVLGVQFAPLNVPFERRLQTLAVAGWLSTLILGQLLFAPLLTLYILFYTKFCYLMLLYLIWIWTIDKDVGELGGRSNRWVRSWTWWKYVSDYFPLRLKKVPLVDLDPKRNYLFCIFPHGVISVGAFHAFGMENDDFKSCFPHHQPHVTTLPIHYQMPLVRELALSLGGISASARSINNILSKPEGGHVCVLIVGGAAEAPFCKPGNYSLYLQRRKGFIKLALKNGTPLVPVLSFGEPDLFREIKSPYLRPLLKIVRKWIGREPAFLMGRGFFQYSYGCLPGRVSVTTVVGKPLEIPKIEESTYDQVNEYHKKFVKALTDLFEEQKYNYLENPEDKKLEIC